MPDSSKRPFYTQDDIRAMFLEDQSELTREVYASLQHRELSVMERNALQAVYPYLEIKNPDVAREAYQGRRPERWKTDAGWQVVDRGDHLLLGRYAQDDDRESGGGVFVPWGTGFQGILSAEEMLSEAFDRWKGGVEWVNGYADLSRLTWMLCHDQDKKLTGYQATYDDLAVYNTLKKVYEGRPISEQLRRKRPSMVLKLHQTGPQRGR